MSMKAIIDKERIYLMNPCADVCAVATLNSVKEDTLRGAIRQVLQHHEILCSHIVIDPDGSAYLEVSSDVPTISLQTYTCTSTSLIDEQEAISFRTDKGEMLRFFHHTDEKQTELVVMAHHLICDGNSLMILMRDILRSLNGCEIESHPLRLLKSDDLDKHPGLNPLLRMMMKSTNKRWKKNGRIFTIPDYETMQAHYHNQHHNTLSIQEIKSPELDGLMKLAHNHHITLNSVLTAAFASVIPTGEGLGIAINVRPHDMNSMGNYAIGISVKGVYDASKSFSDNAEVMHHSIQVKLNNPKEKYFLYEFMRAISPTLIDSIYFNRYSEYQNAISDSVCKMCGYTDKPTGLSLSNLKTISMPDQPEWAYHYSSLYFIPPYMANVRGVIGLSTFHDTLTLALHTDESNPMNECIEGFKSACELLNCEGRKYT